MIDKYARYQQGLSMAELYPQFDKKECACGCGKPLSGRRRRWATDECRDYALDRFLIIKGDNRAIRIALSKRDNGYCNRCGDYDKKWEGHHTLPVYLGGGGCSIDNFETVCQKCHKKAHKTKKPHKKRR